MDDVFYGEAFPFVEPIEDGEFYGQQLLFLDLVEVLVQFEEQQPLSANVNPTHIAPIEEQQPLQDDFLWQLTILMDEQPAPVDDWLMSLTTVMEEQQPLQDELRPTVVYTFEEQQSLVDDMFYHLTVVAEEQQPAGDEIKPGIRVTFDEQQKLVDEFKNIIEFDYQTSFKVKILQLIETHDAFESIILPFNPPNTNVLDDPLNSFEPIIVIDGVTYAGVAPPGVTDLVQWNPQAITGSECDLASYSIGLGFGGGSWEISGPSIGIGLGSQANIAGLVGICTDQGNTSSNSGKYQVASGIFGSRNMNKQMLLVLDKSQLGQVSRLMPNIYLNAPTTTNWTSVAAAAIALAGACSVNLQWAARDMPLTDMFAETGMTIIDALQSLAGRVGGFLCWNGNQGYVVVDPAIGNGGWSAPPCNLISAGGVSARRHLDLSRDIILVQVKTGSKGGISFNANPLQKPPPEQVETIWTISDSIPKEGQQWHVEMPGDFKRSSLINPLANNGRVQVIPAKVGATTSSLFVPPIVSTDDGPKYDHTKWFTAGLPVIHDPKSGKYKLVVTRDLFPVDDLNKGEYVVNIGYVRELDRLQEDFETQIQNNTEKERLRRQSENERIRFLKTGTATLNCLFYGSVPLPGQRASFGYDGAAMSGIIESVNISNGQMSVTIGQYTRVNLMTARSAIDWYYATGSPPA